MPGNKQKGGENSGVCDFFLHFFKIQRLRTVLTVGNLFFFLTHSSFAKLINNCHRQCEKCSTRNTPMGLKDGKIPVKVCGASRRRLAGSSSRDSLAPSLHMAFIRRTSVHAKSLLKFKEPKQSKCHAFPEPRFSKDPPVRYRCEQEPCHFCLPGRAELGHGFSRPAPYGVRISLIRSKTVTGTQSRLAAFPSNHLITRP